MLYNSEDLSLSPSRLVERWAMVCMYLKIQCCWRQMAGEFLGLSSIHLAVGSVRDPVPGE